MSEKVYLGTHESLKRVTSKGICMYRKERERRPLAKYIKGHVIATRNKNANIHVHPFKNDRVEFQ